MVEVLFDNESINSRFQVFLAERPLIFAAEMEYESISIDGRDGNLTREKGYASKPIELRFNYINKNNVKQQFREIVNWLTGKREIKFSDDNDVYRIITKINIQDATNDIKGYVDFTIELETEPFWYQDGGKQTIINTISSINNPSSIECGVVLKVFGNGTCRVRINNNQIVLTDVQEFVVVDGINYIAYKNGISSDSKMSGLYPRFTEGNNEIEIGGATTKVEIETRWCWR